MKIFLWVLAVLAAFAGKWLIATLLVIGAIALGQWQKHKTPKVVAVAPLPLNLQGSVKEMVNECLETNTWLLNCQQKGELHEYEQYLVKRIESIYEEIASKLDGKMAPLDGFRAFIGGSLVIYGVYVALINLLSANLKQLSKERALYLLQTFQADKDCFNEWTTFDMDELRKNVLGKNSEMMRIWEDWKETSGDHWKEKFSGYSYEQANLHLLLEVESARYSFEMSVWHKAVLVPLPATVEDGSAYSDSWFTEKLLAVTKEEAQNRWNKLVVTA
jgi:hypothetical protein